MSGLILPESSPPQVSSSVADKIIIDMNESGARSLYDFAEPTIGLWQPTLREYLLDDQPEIPVLPFDGLDRRAEFRAGALIACLAYLESGIHVSVDEQALLFGQLEANLEGVPDAYTTRLCVDHELGRIIQSVPEAPGLGTGLRRTEYEAALGNGAGWARLVMQQAIAA